MAKSSTAFVCSDCGSEYLKWQGQCVDCGEWNTLARVSVGPNRERDARPRGFGGEAAEVQTLDRVDVGDLERIASGVSELDRVLGGGFVPGSTILLGGSPGAGKSTLLMQVLARLAGGHRALYATGEESLQQVAGRARRLNLPLSDLEVMAETDVETIVREAEQRQVRVLVLDSIQVMYLCDVDGSPGGVPQVKESTSHLVRFAKRSDTVVILVGHVTKEGNIAGPRILEHMIDCFVMLEGESDSRYRTLRSHKNRYGPVNELGFFAMTAGGLAEVRNPSAIFLHRAEQAAPGSVVMVVWEGNRPILVEAQALLDQMPGGVPRRVAVGYDQSRLAMLLAVLHRHGGLEVSDQDVFVNIVGGLRITETSSDLAILVALASSLRNAVVPSDLVVFGEVGLSGEVRPVPNGQERLAEAAKHGFRRAVIPAGNQPKTAIENLAVTAVAHLRDLRGAELL